MPRVASSLLHDLVPCAAAGAGIGTFLQFRHRQNHCVQYSLSYEQESECCGNDIWIVENSLISSSGLAFSMQANSRPLRTGIAAKGQAADRSPGVTRVRQLLSRLSSWRSWLSARILISRPHSPGIVRQATALVP